MLDAHYMQGRGKALHGGANFFQKKTKYKILLHLREFEKSFTFVQLCYRLNRARVGKVGIANLRIRATLTSFRVNDFWKLVKKRILFIILIIATLFACQPPGNDALTIATAANMQFAMEAIVQEFTKMTAIKCETIIASSGKHTAQIKEGAPFDVFVSANMKYPDELYKSELTTDAPVIYAYGKLVAWSLIDRVEIRSELFLDKKIKHVALANPKIAPYGAAAVETLQKAGIFEKVENKLVYGESIAQVNQFVVSRAAEIGFTAKSVVLSPAIKGKGVWKEIDEENYSPIAQGIVILKKSEKIKEANAFMDFLFSETGKTILEKYGYEVNN